nr:glutamate--tRNA ligase, cytoplasmic [Tanacetum cinerariifolium]
MLPSRWFFERFKNSRNVRSVSLSGIFPVSWFQERSNDSISDSLPRESHYYFLSFKGFMTCIKDIPKLKRYEGDGTKDTTFTKEIWIEQAYAKAIVDAKAISPNLEITLMDFGNASIKEIKKASDGNVTELNRVLPPEESVYKATKLKPLTRLSEINELGSLTLVEFGYLLKKKKLGENDDLIDAVNPD